MPRAGHRGFGAWSAHPLIRLGFDHLAPVIGIWRKPLNLMDDLANSHIGLIDADLLCGLAKSAFPQFLRMFERICPPVPVWPLAILCLGVQNLVVEGQKFSATLWLAPSLEPIGKPRIGRAHQAPFGKARFSLEMLGWFNKRHAHFYFRARYRQIGHLFKADNRS